MGIPTEHLFIQACPSFVLYKNISQTDEWFVKDNKNLVITQLTYVLECDNAETSLDRMNLLSNGFKATTTDKGANTNGNNISIWQLAPIVGGSSTQNIPATAR